ncbi:MAG: hypothetical protein CVV41_02390 [Candidatus Riflebacteria bacterium HGW-Riflebacteria-1]|jgi:prepilin-type N-terminal cleavage/methylation domain-containing protein|nr:MAG: hypothetical protein CVV41_02390 [Candidatus Riflebacteria bacterium HGW-Riflebacteria-1]
MKRTASGFTLMEMLIVVTIIAVLAGVGFSYYSDSIEDARIATTRNNLKVVRDAIARYFKDHMTYPTSLEALQGPYLQQPVSYLLVSQLQGNAVVRVEVSNVAEQNIFQLTSADCTWIDYDFGGTGSGNKQIRSIRIKHNGTEMNW